MRAHVTSALEIVGVILLVVAAGSSFGVSAALAVAGVACILFGFVQGN